MAASVLDRLIPRPRVLNATMARATPERAWEALVSARKRVLWEAGARVPPRENPGQERIERRVMGIWRAGFTLNPVAFPTEATETLEFGPRWLTISGLRYRIEPQGSFTRVEVELVVDMGPVILRRYAGAVLESFVARRLELLKSYLEHAVSPVQDSGRVVGDSKAGGA